MRRFLTLFVLALPLAGGCGGKSSDAPRVSAGGATFVDPIMQKWSAEYKKAKNVEIDYVAKGSGYGISNVTSKNTFIFLFGPRMIGIWFGGPATTTADGAAHYDEDVKKQAQQLGLPGW